MAQVHWKLLLLRGGAVGTALALPLLAADASAPKPILAAQPTEIVPPLVVAGQARPAAVILKPGTTSAILSKLKVKRRIPIADLRRQPVLVIGKARLDMTPVLRNPRSPLTIADKLNAQPTVGRVLSSRIEVVEVDQGLVVHQYLSYQLAPGICATSAGRGQVSRVGLSCFTRMDAASRSAAYANPRDPHFIASPAKRGKASAAAAAAAEAEQSQVIRDVAELRRALADPVRRPQVEAVIGKDEARRLETLSDDQVAEELVNLAEVQIEDTMFVPTSEGKQPLAPNAARLKPRVTLPETVDVTKPIAPHTYVTGFTHGRSYEWRHRKSITVKWCVVGCKRTYYVEVFAGFGYGLGLRFPIRIGGDYSYQRKNGQESATFTPQFEPIDGSESDYSDAGLPGDKLFRGKELVAELDAYAGFGYKVPYHTDSVSFHAGKDLTEGLPAPFTGGQFKPPAPGQPLNKEAVFDSPDLLGGLADYGIAGARVLPAVKVGLVSDRLSFKLKDNVAGTEREMTQPGQAFPLAIRASDHSSSFSIGQPVYNLSFEMTPGIAARLFVDVAVWSDSWDWPVWFPQLTLKVPEDGVTFTCHASSICSRDYRYSATITEEKVGETTLPDDPIDRQVEIWRRDFLKRWLAECPQETPATCETAIKAIASTHSNMMANEMHANPFPPTRLGEIYNQYSGQAEANATDVVRQAKVRNIREYGESLIKMYEPAWNKDCADQLCRDRIHAIALEFVDRLVKLQNLAPLAPRSQVHAQVNAEFNPSAKAKAEVEASKNRPKPRLQPVKTLPIKPPAQPR